MCKYTHIHIHVYTICIYIYIGMDQVVTCRNIVNGRLSFPRTFGAECKDLVKKLLVREIQNRLGEYVYIFIYICIFIYMCIYMCICIYIYSYF